MQETNYEGFKKSFKVEYNIDFLKISGRNTSVFPLLGEMIEILIKIFVTKMIYNVTRKKSGYQK